MKVVNAGQCFERARLHTLRKKTVLPSVLTGDGVSQPIRAIKSTWITVAEGCISKIFSEYSPFSAACSGLEMSHSKPTQLQY
jgi:hypothetical protein